MPLVVAAELLSIARVICPLHRGSVVVRRPDPPRPADGVPLGQVEADDLGRRVAAEHAPAQIRDGQVSRRGAPGRQLAAVAAEAGRIPVDGGAGSEPIFFPVTASNTRPRWAPLK
jgi:hypothetical protein